MNYKLFLVERLDPRLVFLDGQSNGRGNEAAQKNVFIASLLMFARIGNEGAKSASRADEGPRNSSVTCCFDLQFASNSVIAFAGVCPIRMTFPFYELTPFDCLICNRVAWRHAPRTRNGESSFLRPPFNNLNAIVGFQGNYGCGASKELNGGSASCLQSLFQVIGVPYGGLNREEFGELLKGKRTNRSRGRSWNIEKAIDERSGLFMARSFLAGKAHLMM